MKLIFTHDGFDYFKTKFKNKNFLFFLLKITSALILSLCLILLWGNKDIENKELKEYTYNLTIENKLLRDDLIFYCGEEKYFTKIDDKKSDIKKKHIKNDLSLLKIWGIFVLCGIIFLMTLFHFTPDPPNKNCKI